MTTETIPKIENISEKVINIEMIHKKSTDIEKIPENPLKQKTSEKAAQILKKSRKSL